MAPGRRFLICLALLIVPAGPAAAQTAPWPGRYLTGFAAETPWPWYSYNGQICGIPVLAADQGASQLNQMLGYSGQTAQTICTAASYDTSYVYDTFYVYDGEGPRAISSSRGSLPLGDWGLPGDELDVKRRGMQR